MNMLEQLNPEQRAAVVHTNGPLLLLAGAGAGKTRVLTYRIAYLIQQGVSPFNILAITFTNKAAREMRERVDAIAEGGQGVWVSTFHSFCVRVLRREIDNIGYDSRFTIYDADDSERLVKTCLKELNINDKLYPVRTVASVISDFKNELVSPELALREYSEDFRKKTVCEVYALYQKKLRLNNALDFDDLIFCTVRLFTACEDVLSRYRQRFQYIMVDEYQDTNTSQYMLVRLLAQEHKNICVVGDDDQSIYGWRGANIRNILEFEMDYANTRTIKLEQNYRSTKTILQAANAVISHNTQRKQKTLWTSNAQGAGIQYYKADSDREEGAYIVDKITSAVSRGAAELKDFAVLYRNNAQSRVIEDAFVKRGIAYRLLGGVRFYERREIKDVLAYLKSINNPHDTIALMRIINVPRRGIGDTTLQRVADYADEAGVSFFGALHELENISGLGARAAKLAGFRDLMDGLIGYAQTAAAGDVIDRVLEDTRYIDDLEALDPEEAAERIANIDELVSKAADFDGEDRSLAAFLDEVALVADVDGYKETDDAVVMMTLHSSKGLEFKNVFITGFEEGIFPSYRSTSSPDPNALEEERRLCYVGMTRAKESLVITSAFSRMQHGEFVYNAPSRFLKEIPKSMMAGHKPKPAAPAVRPTAPAVRPAAAVSKPYTTYQNARVDVKPGLALDFGVGDSVVQQKYGQGVVRDIRPAGADFEVAVSFPGIGVKKFMAHLSKLTKVE